jgi:hypothetical protein
MVKGEGYDLSPGLWLTLKKLLSGIQKGKTFFNLMFLNSISSRNTGHTLSPEACAETSGTGAPLYLGCMGKEKPFCNQRGWCWVRSKSQTSKTWFEVGMSCHPSF